MASLRLRAPAEPAFALPVRTFVAAASRYLGIPPDLSEDLRLASNELFAIAVEGGVVASVDVRLEGGPPEATLTVEGVPGLDGRGDEAGGLREQMLRGLFPSLSHDGTTVVIRASEAP